MFCLQCRLRSPLQAGVLVMASRLQLSEPFAGTMLSWPQPTQRLSILFQALRMARFRPSFYAEKDLLQLGSLQAT
jgi:hypothetical protein